MVGLKGWIRGVLVLLGTGNIKSMHKSYMSTT